MNSPSLHRIGCKSWRRRFGTNGLSRHMKNYRLPKAEKERLELAVTIGADGDQLLAAVDAAVEQPWLAQLPAIHVLREVWTAQYIKEDGQLRWRTVQEMPATAEQISSPYDPEARYGKKRDISWTGYKAHLTETCDPETPHVITDAETTLATTPDGHMLSAVHRSLASSELLPSEHLVDMGYTGCRMLVDSQQRPGLSLSARSRRYKLAGAAGRVQQGRLSRRLGSASRDLPRGQTEYLWLPSTYPKSGMQFEARFARNDCAACPGRTAALGRRSSRVSSRCTHARIVTHCPPLDEIRQPRSFGRAMPREPASKARMRRQFALRLAQMSLYRVGEDTFTACQYSRRSHLVRVAEWHNDTPSANTRISQFAALQMAA